MNGYILTVPLPLSLHTDKEVAERCRGLSNSESHLIFVNTCDSVSAGLVQINWVDVAFMICREVFETGVGLNVYFKKKERKPRF